LGCTTALAINKPCFSTNLVTVSTRPVIPLTIGSIALPATMVSLDGGRTIFSYIPILQQVALPLFLYLISSFLGQIAVELKLGKNLIKHKVLIANIPIEGILGMDFLEINNCDVLLSKSCIRYRGNEIPCFKYKNNGKATCCRIGIYEKIVLPPSSETIVAGLEFPQLVYLQSELYALLNSFQVLIQLQFDPEMMKFPQLQSSF
jgi:hypothetical protein